MASPNELPSRTAMERRASERPLPVLDREAMLATVEQDLELLRELVEIFLAESPGLLAQMRAGIRDRNAEAVERAAHTVKGAVGNFGGAARFAGRARGGSGSPRRPAGRGAAAAPGPGRGNCAGLPCAEPILERGGPMNILLAEDDKVQSRLLERHLKDRGYQVRAAFDADAAWKAATQDPPDLILLDLQMPGGTGLGLLKKRSASARLRAVPVIVITGMEDPLVLRMAEQHGVESVFRKPVDLILLDVVLESVRSQLPLRPAGTSRQ